jgi:hypothetical protein
LLTSIGVKDDIEMLNEYDQLTEIFNDDEYSDLEEEYNDISFEDVFGKIETENSIETEDIKIYEIEEEINLGFDPKVYLPTDFNPYEGMNTLEELDFEAKIAFEAVFGTIYKEEILKIEDIKVYEIEEEINLGFNTQECLPTDFNPYEGMNTKEELNFEAKISFEAVFGAIEKEEILKIEDIKVYEIEEEV